MTSATSSPSSSNKNKKIIWFWQSNPNLWDENEQKEWKRYSDFENEFIEEAYQKKEKEVQLNDYVINFKYNIQSKKHNRNIQRPIKREELDVCNYVREEKFCHPDRALISFAHEYSDEHNFVYKWVNENDQIKWDFPAVAELAAQGKSSCSVLQLKNLSLPLF